MFRSRKLQSVILALATLAVASAAAPSRAFVPVPAVSSLSGPPWISIEYPANPHDRTTRGAFLLVHAFYHGTPVDYPVSGTAEGMVNGERKSVSLQFERTSRPGVYALKRQWSADGVWTLVISVTQEKNDVAQALVEIAPTGEVTSVRVPTTEQNGWSIPRKLTSAEIEASLRNRASALVRRG